MGRGRARGDARSGTGRRLKRNGLSLWTILVGIVAALFGSAIVAGLDVADTDGVDWVEWLIQIGLAALGVAALDRSKARR